MRAKHSLIIISVCCLIMLILSYKAAHVKQDNRLVRIAKIEVYPACLEVYRAALAEEIKAAIRVEPGVFALQAVYNRADPTKVTVFEVYASDSAYQTHLKTPHFLKYKNRTWKMIKSLELIEVEPIALEFKSESIENSR